jgi:hypothetical protein
MYHKDNQAIHHKDSQVTRHKDNHAIYHKDSHVTRHKDNMVMLHKDNQVTHHRANTGTQDIRRKVSIRATHPKVGIQVNQDICRRVTLRISRHLTVELHQGTQATADKK